MPPGGSFPSFPASLTPSLPTAFLSSLALTLPHPRQWRGWGCESSPFGDWCCLLTNYQPGVPLQSTELWLTAGRLPNLRSPPPDRERSDRVTILRLSEWCLLREAGSVAVPLPLQSLIQRPSPAALASTLTKSPIAHSSPISILANGSFVGHDLCVVFGIYNFFALYR